MKKIYTIVIALLLTAVCTGYGFAAGAPQDVRYVWKESIEKPAPDFVLKDVNGNRIQLADYKGKVVLLDFTTTWCPYCHKIRQYLEKIHDRYKNKEFVLLSIYIQESREKVKSYTDKHKIPFTALLDKDGSVAESFAVVGVPTLVLLNKKGDILCKQCRSIDVILEEMF
jgi:peroxiredoxin